jgi:hypothetical protein
MSYSVIGTHYFLGFKALLYALAALDCSKIDDFWVLSASLYALH